MDNREQNLPEQRPWEQTGEPQAGAAAGLEYNQSPVLPEGALPLPKGSPPDGKKRRTWLWVLACALLLAAAVVTVLLTVVLPAGSGSSLVYNPISPMCYEEDGVYYVAAGEESIELEGFQQYKYGLNTGMDAGKTYLYYLADAKRGKGTLMRLKLGYAAAEPETCAEDVCSAKISADGSRALLLKDIDDGVGDLYIWTVSGEEKLDTSVVLDSCYFSSNGRNFCYTKADSGDSEDKTFFLKVGDAAPEKVADVEGIYAYGYPTDDGELLYQVSDDYTDGKLYRYAGGEEDRIGNGFLHTVFNSRELLYRDDNRLYYYKNGSRERISREYQGVFFAQEEVYTVGVSYDKHFVLAEGSEDDMTLYEYGIGSNPVKITKTDSRWVKVSNNFDWVAYENKGTQYLAHKKGSGWKNRIKVMSDVSSSAFDRKGRYLYVVDSDGEFGRYILAEGEYEELYDDVESYTLIGDDIYVITQERELYRITASFNELIAEDVADIAEAAGGGFYVVVDAADGSQDIEYYAPGADKGESVARGVDRSGLYAYSSIDYITDDEEEDGF